MTTAQQILSEAFSEIGLLDPADTLSAEDASFGLTKLNTIIDTWAADAALSFTTTTTVFNLPGGTNSRTIGPAQQIDIARPGRIESASFVRVGNVDHPLRVVDQATYNSIGIKDIGGLWPAYAYFDGGFPNGNIFFWPTGAAEIHLVTSSQLTAFADLLTDYGLPPGYKEALVLTLAEALQRPYGKPDDVLLIRAAANARRRVKTVTVPQLDTGWPTISDRTRLLGIV